ncbi:hypothetical protein B9Z19DRAFT_1126922 [Tuber borchii]|uniref:Uncharacterized protein n=1 Tax=Tuber borchii TaxID=42251 RepID=A0A2T6ZS67_TUBBO|nr:hypothetical protein B9Z19DRAFT_1126922 [Tuber borchii]
MATGSSGGAATIMRKKSVTWALPTLSRPRSPPPVVILPTHPPPCSATPQIEEELTLEFQIIAYGPAGYCCPIEDYQDIGARTLNANYWRESFFYQDIPEGTSGRAGDCPGIEGVPWYSGCT